MTEYLKSGGEISLHSLETDIKNKFGDYHVRIYSMVMEKLADVKGIEEIIQEDGTIVMIQRMGNFN